MEYSQTHEEMEKDICQKLGIRLIRISTSQKIALAGIGLFQIRRAIVAALNNYVGEYIQAWICMCGTFFLATLDESFTLEYVSKEIAKQKLAEFKEARKNQINTLCFDLIRINEQTLKGLQFLFNQLIGV